MHRCLLLTGLILLSLVSHASAQTAQFPYEAEVVAAENRDTYVRSGPGQRYYPTSVLKRGERVTVRRHDPGGWYMIDPPAGSFSWLRADYVQKNGDVGTVTEQNVVARVGSVIEPEKRDVEQIRLSRGDQVKILGEQTAVVDGRSVQLYKIAPPRFEYRWMMGKFLVPADPNRRRQAAKDPYWAPPTKDLAGDDSVPTASSSTRTSQTSAQFEKRPHEIEEAPEPSDGKNHKRSRSTAATDKAVNAGADTADQRRLNSIDDEFRGMIEREPTFWNLDRLERQYEDVQAGTNSSDIARQVVQRLAAVDRYRKTQQEYEQFVQITKATSERDSQLLAMQHSHVDGPAGAVPNQPLVDAPPPDAPIPDPGFQQGFAHRPVTPPASPTVPGKPDGAGIVQRAAATYAGAPRHVLLAPNGRILAYLQAARGVNLDEHLGQERGVYGERAYNRSLRADLIHVRRLIPVRLQVSSPPSR
ncbi:MAG: SH3 domain-containing protein [Planctomycetaceae bacterium]